MPEYDWEAALQGVDPVVKARFQGEMAKQKAFVDRLSPVVPSANSSIVGPEVFLPSRETLKRRSLQRGIVPEFIDPEVSEEDLAARARLDEDPANTAAILRQAGLPAFQQALHWVNSADDAFKLTLGTVPDKEAQIQFFAKLLPGTSEEFIRENFDDVKRDFIFRDMRLLIEDNDLMAKWMSNPRNMALAWDSGRQLSALRDILVSRSGSFFEHVGAGLKRAALKPTQAVLYAAKIGDDASNWLNNWLSDADENLTPKQIEQNNKLMSHYAHLRIMAHFGNKQAQREIDKLLKLGPGKAQEYMSARMDGLSETIERYKTQKAVNLTDEVSGIYRFGVDLPGVAADLLTKVAMGPAAAGGTMFLEEGGSLYTDLRQEGLSGKESAAWAIPVGLVNAIIEQAQIGKVSKLFNIKQRLGKEGLKKVIVASLKDMTENVAQETLQNVITTAGTLGATASKRGLNTYQVIDELGKSFGEGLYEGLLVGVSSAIFGLAAIPTNLRRIRVNQAQRTALWWIGKHLNETNLYKRDPERFQEALDTMLAGENVGDVVRDARMDAESFNQKVPAALRKEVLDALGISERVFEEALAAGEEIRFTMGSWAKVAPTQVGTNLFKHIRFGPDGMNAKDILEAVAFAANVAAEVAEIHEDMLRTNPEGMTAKQRATYVAQFEATGLPNGYARNYVNLMDRMLRRAAGEQDVLTEETAGRIRFIIDAETGEAVPVEAARPQAAVEATVIGDRGVNRHGAPFFNVVDAEGKKVGHLAGVDDKIGTAIRKDLGLGEGAFFSLQNTQLNESERGKGLYQKALQQVANRHPQGLVIEKYQASPALQAAARKIEGHKETEDNIHVPPQEQVAAEPTLGDITFSREELLNPEQFPGTKPDDPMSPAGTIQFQRALVEDAKLDNPSEVVPPTDESGVEGAFKGVKSFLYTEVGILSDLIDPDIAWHQPPKDMSLIEYGRLFFSPEGIAALRRTFEGDEAPDYVEDKKMWQSIKKELQFAEKLARGERSKKGTWGKNFLAGNRKTGGFSWDFGLVTCMPTTRCSVCYAKAAAAQRKKLSASRIRHSIVTALYPEVVGEAVADFVKTMTKGEFPMLRVNGAGDTTFAWQIDAVNKAIENLDRPLHIFSRSHIPRTEGSAGLNQISNGGFKPGEPGSGVSVFKMGSIDKQLVQEYGYDFLRENLEERGIINSYLVGDVEDIPIVKDLRERGIFMILHVHARNDIIKALDDAGLLTTGRESGEELAAPACPCALEAGPFYNGCATCLVSQGPCFAWGSQIMLTPEGDLISPQTVASALSLAVSGRESSMDNLEEMVGSVPMAQVGLAPDQVEDTRREVVAKAYDMAVQDLKAKITAAKRKKKNIVVRNPRTRERIVGLKADKKGVATAEGFVKDWTNFANRLRTEVDVTELLASDQALIDGFESMKRAVEGVRDEKGETLYQAVKDAPQGVRGATRFRGQSIDISLFKGKWDASTPIHELFHTMRRLTREAVENGTASPRMVELNNKLEAFMEKAKRGEEDAADMFETYFMEGKAPAAAMGPAFAMFKDLLIDVYKETEHRLENRAPVTPDMREIFNAWIATEDEVELAEEYNRTYESAADIILKKPDKQMEKLKSRAKVEREKHITAEVRDRVKAWKDGTGGREAIYEQAQKEVEAVPIYKVMNIFKDLKGIDLEDLKTYFTDVELQDMISELRDKHGFDLVNIQGRRITLEQALGNMADTERANDLQVVAEKNGFDDPKAMVLEMQQVPSQEDAVNQRADQLEQEYADAIMTNANAEIGATHNDITLEMLVRDIERLERLERGQQTAAVRRAKLKALHDQVRKELSSTLSYRNAAQYRRWANLEIKHAREAIAAATRGDRKAALQARRKQLKYHAAIVQSVKMREQFAKYEKFLGGRNMESKLKNVSPEYANPTRNLLFSFRANSTTTPSDSDYKIQVAMDANNKEKFLLIGKGDELIGEYNSRIQAVNAWRDIERDSVVTFPTLVLKGKEDSELDAILLSPDDAIPVWIKEKIFPSPYTNIKDLTFDQIEDFVATVKQMLMLGSEELTALKELGAERADEYAQRIIERMEKLPNFHAKGKDVASWLGKLKKMTSKFSAYMIRPTFLMDAMDGYVSLKGEKTGPAGLMYDLLTQADAMYDNIIEEHMEGNPEKGIPGLRQAHERIAKGSNWVNDRMGGAFFPIEGVPIPQVLRDLKGWDAWTYERVLAVVFNMGNDANRGPLLKSVYGFSEEQLQKIAEVLPADVLEAINDVWQSIDIYEQLADAVETMTFRRPPKEEPMPFTVRAADGKTVQMRGGYYPLKYDSDIDPEMGKVNERQNIGADILNRSTYNTARPDMGTAKARVRDAETGESLSARPIDLSLGVLADKFTKSIRVITHSALLFDMHRITTNPEFHEMFIKKFGPQQYRALRGMLNRAARPERKVTNAWFETLRGLHTMSALGLRVMTSGKQTLSAANAVQEMNNSAGNNSGYRYLIWGSSTLAGGQDGIGNNPMEVINFVDSVDPVMKARSKSATRDMRDFARRVDLAKGGFLNRIKRSQKWAQEMGFMGIKFFDTVTTYSVWLGAYKQALELGLEGVAEAKTQKEAQAAAVRYARRVVKVTQPSGMPSEQSAMQAEEGPMRLFTQFMSFKNVDFNRFMHRVAAIKKGQIGARSLGMYIINERLIPAMAIHIPALLLYDDDEKPKWWQFFIAPGMDLVAGIPMARDIASGLERTLAGGFGRTIDVPLLQWFNHAQRATQKFSKGKYGEGAYEAYRVLEWFSGVPLSNPVNDARKYYKRIAGD